MSTRYISSLLPPDRASTVLRIVPYNTEGSQQPGHLRIIGTMEAHGEMRTLTSGQDLESVFGWPPGCGQVDRVEGGEPAAEQLIKRHVENGEDRDTQERLPIQRPGAGSSLRVAPQLVGSVPAASDDQRRSGGHLLAAQSRTLLDPFAWHPPRSECQRLRLPERTPEQALHRRLTAADRQITTADGRSRQDS